MNRSLLLYINNWGRIWGRGLKNVLYRETADHGENSQCFPSNPIPKMYMN